jgi:methionyl aminopeptidase
LSFPGASLGIIETRKISLERMIPIKTHREIESLFQAGAILAGCLQTVRAATQVGVSTRSLDAIAERYILDHGGTPAFKGYQNFPSSLCVSINDEVVHGLPGSYRIKNGDIVSLDSGVRFQGLIADSAITFAVGEVSPQVEQLMLVTEQALHLGIAQAQPGNCVRDISRAIQNHVEKFGLGLVRTLMGHGVGRSVHEEPQIPNFDTGLPGPRLEPGMVLAIEPMVTMGSYEVRVKTNGWSVATVDRSLSAHSEHTVAVTLGGPVIVTALS